MKIKVKKFLYPLLFLGAISAYLLLAFKLTGAFDFNDETEKYLAAELLLKGHKLYGDIFVQHGPFAYIPSHLFHYLFGFNGLQYPRAIPIVFSLISILCIFASGIFELNRSKFFAATVYVLFLSLLQAQFSLVQTMYQVYAGYISVSIIALSLFPLLIRGTVDNLRGFFGGVFIGLLFYSAFSFAISIFIYFIVLYVLKYLGYKFRIRYVYFGFLLSTALVGLWLFLFGDMKGYFVAHFYINVVNYGHYLAGLTPFLASVQAVPFLPFLLYYNYNVESGGWYVLFLFTLIPLIAITFFKIPSINRVHPKWLSLSLCVLISLFFSYLNPRLSIGFATSTILISLLGAFAMIFSFVVFECKSKSIKIIYYLSAFAFLILTLVMSFVSKTWLYGVTQVEYYQSKLPVQGAKTFDLDYVNSVLDPTDGILSLPFDLTYYVSSNRIPATGIFYWMPWQNDYKSNPILGYGYNLCDSILTHPPKIINYTDFPVWENPTDSFMGCVKSLLIDSYSRAIFSPTLWVRNDLVEVTKSSSYRFLRPNSRFSGDDAISLSNLPFSSVHTIKTSDNLCPTYVKDAHGQVVLGVCNLNPRSNVYFYESGDNSYKIIGLGKDQFESKPECLEIEGALIASGAKGRFWPCSPVLNQDLAAVDPSKSTRLKFKHSNLCLDVNFLGELIQSDCSLAKHWEVE